MLARTRKRGGGDYNEEPHSSLGDMVPQQFAQVALVGAAMRKGFCSAEQGKGASSTGPLRCTLSLARGDLKMSYLGKTLTEIGTRGAGQG